MGKKITKRIDEISFGVLSPQTIKKMGVTEVNSPELYDADGYPVEKGIMDPAMGVIDPGLRCKTCGGKVKSCPGHFGYVSLSKPTLHIFYADEIYKCLRSTCSSCGRIILPEKFLEKWKPKMKKALETSNIPFRKKISKKVKNKVKRVKECPYCGEEKEDIDFNKPTAFKEGGKRIWPNEIRSWLEKIPDSDLYILGIDPEVSRPEWMVLTLLPIPPITMRPSITLESGGRSEDDLTHKISDIIRVNQRLLENINAGAPEIIVEDLWDLLQYHITTYFNNTLSSNKVPPARHRSNRPLKTLTERFKSKEGIFRQNLAGKRVNFCARSVISPDPFLNINEVGVPAKVARELTIPERVTEWNIDWLKKLIKRGDDYPGANYVITPEKSKRRIAEEAKDQIIEELEPGWIVERHLQDGDVVLFNRQPSLHRLSIIAHRVKVVPGKTLRLNPVVCTPYNADFDGDEMNLHVPQTEEARAEAENLVLLDHQIVTPRYGLTIIGIEGDARLGIHELTSGMSFSKEDTAELLIASGREKSLPKPDKKNEWTGKQIFSLLLPDDLNFEHKDLTVKKGKVKEGVVTEKFIGPEGGLLLHDIYKKYGAEYTSKLIDKINRLGLAVTKKKSYSLSFYDFDLDERAEKKIRKIADKGEKEAKKIISKFEKGNVRALPGQTAKETAEAKVLERLNSALDNSLNVIKNEIEEDNNLVKFAKAGVGAKLLNLAQISGFAGQQALRGERINIGYRKRTLPHFKKNDLSPRCRGFVKRGYSHGLDPIELFFNIVVGREALMDTAMRTPKSGYLQRRLINALQDLKVSYDGTVRDSAKRIMQFKFSGDGVDVSKSYHGGVKVDK